MNAVAKPSAKNSIVVSEIKNTIVFACAGLGIYVEFNITASVLLADYITHHL